MPCKVASLVHVHGYVHAHGEDRELHPSHSGKGTIGESVQIVREFFA
jgi:hypothetical protein